MMAVRKNPGAAKSVARSLPALERTRQRARSQRRLKSYNKRRITELRCGSGSPRPSLFDRFLFEHSRSLAQPPLIDYLDVEAPVTPDFETGQLSLLQQAVDRRAMHSQILC